MGLVVYVDGKFVPKEEATISVYDHGFLYGDGVFEGIRAYDGRVFKLNEHLDRLYASAKSLLLEIPLSKEEMEAAVLKTLRKNELSNAYIRLIVTRGKGDLGLDPNNCSNPTVVIITDKISLYPGEMYQRGLEIITVSTSRNILNPTIKSLNYLNNILAKIEVNRAGVLEGIMLSHNGFVAEATGDNVFIVRDGILVTPPSHIGILEGITRNAVMELAKDLGINFCEGIFTQSQVYNADECFLTGTAAEIIPVVRIDGRIIGKGAPGPITQKLIEEFHKYTRKEGTVIS